MKKLLLILSAVFVSVTGWAATEADYNNWGAAHPYAYNLKSSYNANRDTLILSYMLNANALNNRNLNTNAIGVQIHFLNDNGDIVYTNTKGGINKTTNKNQPHIVKIAVKDINIANEYKDKPLRWMVRVWGPESRTLPKIVSSSTKKPVNAYGVAINSIATHPNFGKVYVSEASPSSTDNKNSLLQFDAATNYVNRIRKYKHYPKELMENRGDTSYFSASPNKEPHRVKISEDGRVFVSCYHPTAGAIVLEYLGNNEFTSIIEPDLTANKNNNNTGTKTDTQDKHFRRVVGMDVKGSGEDLKILVCWINPNDEYRGRLKDPSTGVYRECYDATIECIEYQVGKAEKDGVLISKEQPLGQATGTYAKSVAKYKDYYTANYMPGLIYQGYEGGWNSGNRGFVDVVYGANNIIWMKIDYAASVGRVGRIVAFKDGKELKTNHMTQDADGGGYYGGNGIFYDAENDIIITGAGAGKIKMYTINSNTGVLTEKSAWQLTENTASGDKRIGHWVTAFAKDHANNLYAITQKEWTTGESYTANVLTIAMPYSGDGKRETLAQETITISDPIPNILATDLRYDIVRGKNQYEFSFNVNTKPEEAQIRFYESYDAMKNSLNAVNADNYDGTNNNKPLFVYNIPSDKLKQGRIAVKLGAVGGQVDANGVITNDRLPAGVLYWSVYVKTRKSNVFAPTCRLEGVTDTQGAHRRYATVNNYPETDMFGSFIVADNPAGDDVNGGYHGLMIYGINPEGNSNDEQSDISNGVRYSHRESYLNSGVASASDKLNFPRRLVVAPDGRVFIADQGTTDAADYAGSTTVVQHVRGGVRIWDPADPKKFTLFSHNKIGTSFGVSLWEHPAANGGLKIYASNAYEEYLKHYKGSTCYTDDQKNGIFGWNGLAEYTLSAHPNGSANWSKPDSVHYALGRGDASGNYSLVAMDKGIWMCQHREHNRQLKDEALQPLADNLDAVLLSFFPYGSTKAETWNSCTNNGVNNYDDATKRAERADASDLTQKKTSPIQSTPGAGMAYRKIDGKEYLFVVNHDGNIAQILIDGWTGSGATATPKIDASKVKILVTPAYTKGDRDVDKTSTKWHTAFITTINFDYAGNLVTTTGKSFGQAHDIIVYTMPYDRVNAREIQAPNSCRMIPERIAHLDMDKEDLDELIKEHKIDHPEGCAIDLYRPLQGGMFNTICLPCTLDLKTLPEGHPLYEAELKEYTGLNLNTVGGEKVLELVFTDVTDKIIIANKPYIIQPEENYNSIIRFAGPLQLTDTTGKADRWAENSNNYNITYRGIIPYQKITPTIQDGVSLTLMLVADNRLALMTSAGDMYGFRGYFMLNKPLPKGMQTRITNSKGTTTNTTIVVDGKKVNVEKYLQEGRVYIRMGEDLYNIDGQKVE